MPMYITLMNFTDQGRKDVATMPDRADGVAKRIEAEGGTVIGSWLTMGRFDQIAVVEAPNDEAAAKLLLIIAGRGNVATETLRAFTMDEVRALL
jgi:uncharacterized protein with GYD domain